MTDLYSPPTMPLYWDRLIADTADLTAEEMGVYMRLLYRQWTKGSIPASIEKQARIGGVSAKAMRTISESIGPRLQSHPAIPGAVHSPFMESVRERGRAHAQSQAANGKRGALKRWHSDAIATLSPSHSDPAVSPMAKNSFPVSSIQYPIADANASASRDTAPRLPLRDDTAIKAKAILAAIWPRLEPSMSGAMTKTEWGRRNMRYARDLVAAGASIEAIIAAYEVASERLGEPCRQLNIVQDQLARGERASDCGCGLGAFDCERLHTPHNTTTDLLPTIADLETSCSR